MRIAIATDAWRPQLNGVVVTLEHTIRALREWGHEVEVIEPSGFLRCPFPGYPEIELAVAPGSQVQRRLDAARPDAVHIVTEGPIGLAARAFCIRRGWPFTTAFHTRFPEYLSARGLVPAKLTYAYLRHFHSPATRCMVSTESLRMELQQQGFTRLALWGRGVDTDRFRPRSRTGRWPGPVYGYLGRLAVEKNVDGFLRLPLRGTRVVIGDGPDRARLGAAYPDAVFVGRLDGDALPQALAEIDVLVFPSLTDTFGLVMLEAMACGIPVAAHPVQGPRDVIQDGRTGALDTDLGRAVERALGIDRDACRRFAATHSWQVSARQFLEHLAVIETPQAATA